jgi:hypothetical protein
MPLGRHFGICTLLNRNSQANIQAHITEIWTIKEMWERDLLFASFERPAITLYTTPHELYTVGFIKHVR